MGDLRNILSRVTVLCLTAQLTAVRAASVGEKLPEINGDIFYYFGYGSNLLGDRIHIQNPTAQRMEAGLLREYRLDFYRYAARWDGAVATVVPTADMNVSGALWQIALSNMQDIDNQEGVSQGIYEPFSAPIELANKTVIYARSYRLVKQPSTDINELDPAELPEERQPSKTYLRCIVKGAVETGLPEPYIDGLRAFKHNGRMVDELEDQLCLHDVLLND